jgi:hypothetical protein
MTSKNHIPCSCQRHKITRKGQHDIEWMNPRMWVCGCGKKPEFVEDDWRWNEEIKGWEHLHPDGHVSARRIEP